MPVAGKSMGKRVGAGRKQSATVDGESKVQPGEEKEGNDGGSRPPGGDSLVWLVDARARFGRRQQAAFDEDGFVLVPRLLSDEGLDHVRRRVDEIHRGKHESIDEEWILNLHQVAAALLNVPFFLSSCIFPSVILPLSLSLPLSLPPMKTMRHQNEHDVSSHVSWCLKSVSQREACHRCFQVMIIGCGH